MWPSFLTWLKDNQIGDLTGVAGVVISVVGFVATLIGVAKSKSAAIRAEEAAQDTRNSIRKFDAILDFSANIAALEEIRRLQRQGAWSILPDRYAAIRRFLVTFRHSMVMLSDDQKSQIQNAIVNFRAIEAQIDKSQGNPGPSVAAKINRIFSEQFDELLVILQDFKSANDRGLT